MTTQELRCELAMERVKLAALHARHMTAHAEAAEVRIRDLEAQLDDRPDRDDAYAHIPGRGL